MGIRRHLKATLGLLAVGSVAFAGVAHAGGSTTSKDRDVHVKQIGHPNILKVKQTGTNDTVGSGTGKKRLLMVAKDSKGNDYENKLIVKQTGDTDKVLNVYDQDDLSNAKEDGNIVAPGKIDVEITQSGASATVNFGVLKATTKDSSNNQSITLKITQQGSDTATFKDVSVGTMDLSVTQAGGSKFLLADDEANLSDRTDKVEVKGAVSGSVNQSGASTFKANQVTVYGNMNLHNSNGSGDLTQAGASTIAMDDVTVGSSSNAANLNLNVDQEDAGTITLKTDTFAEDGGNATFNVTQKDSGTDKIDIENTTTKQKTSFTVTQEGTGAKTLTIGTVKAVTVKGTTDFTLTQKDAGAKTMDIENATFGDASTDKLTVDVTQDGAGKAEITFGSKTDEIEVDGDATIKIKQTDDNSVQKADSYIEFDEMDIKGNFTMKGYDTNNGGDYFTQSGSNNHYVVKEVDTSGNFVLANYTSGKSNDITLKNVVSKNATIETYINGKYNSITFRDFSTADSSGNAAASETAKIKITGDYVTIDGASKGTDFATEDTKGLYQVSSSLGDNKANNEINIEVYSNAADSNSVNGIHIYQSAGSHLASDNDVQGVYASHANYLHIVEGSASNKVSGNDIALYQYAKAGGNYADITVASSGNTISILQSNNSGDNVVDVYQGQ